MTSLVQQALQLWQNPPTDQQEALDAFGALYADPVTVNGSPTPVRVLVDRARGLHQSFEGLNAELLEQTETRTHTAFAFRLSGQLVGPLPTPLGEIQPTGRERQVMAMDLFRMEGDRIVQIWTVADYAGLIAEAASA